MTHVCHAMGCEVPVPPEMLMCRTHWFLVPNWIRSQVWSTYRTGQCDDMNPSGSWMIAATRAICAVAVKEGLLTKEQAEDRIGREIERFTRYAKEPPTRLINIRGTDHRGNHVYIGRGSPFGNPYSHTPDGAYKTILVHSREQAIASYRSWLNGDDVIDGWPKPTHAQIMALRGKTLACYCTPLPCHGDVLLDYIEAGIDVSEDVGGVSPIATVSSEPRASSIIAEGSGGGTDLRRGAVLIGCENPEVQSGTLTRPLSAGDIHPQQDARAGNGHQAGAAPKAVEPVPPTSSGYETTTVAPRSSGDAEVGSSGRARMVNTASVGTAPGQYENLSPFLRWPGGKRWLVEQLVPKILHFQPSLYVEPFLGAGAIALALPPTIPMLLNDYSEPLVNLWRCIQRTPRIVGTMARACVENLGNTREGYLLARDHFNSLTVFDENGPPMEALERAALMLYLNATSYNGVWRENKRGGYNVPFGDVKQPAISSVEELVAISEHLGSAHLMWGDFADPIARITDEEIAAGVVIYADPPYHSGFDDYVAGGFPDVEHERLADRLFEVANRGAHVFTTNADTPFIRELYKHALGMDVVMEARNVAQKTTSRKAVSCLLIEV